MYIGKEGFETSTVLTIAVCWLVLQIMYRRCAARRDLHLRTERMGLKNRKKT